jgi:hypothetical protein
MIKSLITWAGVIIAGLLLFLLAYTLAAVVGAGRALAHDIYSELRQPGTGFKCCGGVGPDADCEALDFSQISERNGSFVIDSKRWGRPVLLGTGRIVFSGVPGEKPGTAGHWCGKPRTMAGYGWQTSDDQPDPTVWTFCAYIAPGGV